MGKATLMLVLLSAGAAFGIGYVTGTSSAPADNYEDEYTDDTPPGPTRTPAPIAGGPTGPALEGNPQADTPIRAAIAAFPIPKADRGTGRILGIVQTSTGEPLEGVKVKLTPQPEYDRSEKPPEDPEEALVYHVKRQIERTRWTNANMIEAISGADGRFKLEGVVDRKHRIDGTKDGWKLNAQPAWNLLPGTEVVLTATKVTGLKLEVYGPDGKVPPHASTMLKSGRSNMGGHWSPTNQVLDAAPGSYALTVKAGTAEELRAGPIDVTIEDGDEMATLRVDLELKPVLRVRLDFPKGEATNGNMFYALAPNGEMPTPAELRANGKQDYMGRHYYGHPFGPTQAAVAPRTFSDLEVGTYAVGFARGNTFAAIELVEVAPGLNEKTLQIPEMDPSEYVIVKARGPKGKPLAGVTFMAGYKSGRRNNSSQTPVATRPGGEYLVLHYNRGTNAEEGTYWLNVQSQQYGTQRVEYAKGTGSLTVDFQEPATIEVHVSGIKSGAVVGKVRVTLREKQHGQSASGECNSDGLAILKGLQPGEYEARLNVGQRRMPGHVLTQDVTVRPGKQTLQLTMPTLYTVTVRGATSSTMLRNDRRTDPKTPRLWRHGQPTDGEVIFAGIPAGAYTVRSGRGRAAFVVPGTTIVTLEEKK